MQDETTTPVIPATAPGTAVGGRRSGRSKDTATMSANGGAVYGLGMIGAAVYFFTTATTRDERLLAIPKAIVWPAILVYLALKRLDG
jgi:hypothetical protein